MFAVRTPTNTIIPSLNFIVLFLIDATNWGFAPAPIPFLS
jgi:hypothetical protein